MFANKELTFFIPNEIFDDLKQLKYKSNNHYSFTVCYYVLTSYLYYVSYYGFKLITNADIKKTLGYHSHDKRIDYIIKNNGLLDLIGYTISTSNYPINTTLDLHNYPEFDLINDYSKCTFNKYFVKYPVKGFHRYDIQGTFFDVSNTTKIDINIFINIIKILGCSGFLIYLYFKSKGRIKISYDKLSKILLISNRRLFAIINELELNKYIKVIHAKCFKGNKDANIYIC
jgi:hypothetical protein